VNENERERIKMRALEKMEQGAALDWQTPQSPFTKRRGDSVFYGDTELFSLKPYIEEEQKYHEAHPPAGEEAPAAYYIERAATPGPDKTLLSLTIYYRNDIPAPYTPHVTKNFVIYRGAIVPLERSDQIWRYVAASEDGSHWLYSLTPDEYTARNYAERGELVLFGAGGEALVVYALPGVSNIEAVTPLENGMRVVASDRASLFGASNTAEDLRAAYGIYDVNTNGSFKMISDLYGFAYVDAAGNSMSSIRPKTASRRSARCGADFGSTGSCEMSPRNRNGFGKGNGRATERFGDGRHNLTRRRCISKTAAPRFRGIGGSGAVFFTRKTVSSRASARARNGAARAQ